MSPLSDYARLVSPDGVPSPEATAKQIDDTFEAAPQCKLRFSASLFDECVVVDDNQLPYSVRPVDQLSKYPDMNNSIMLVALHKRIMLDAPEAEDVILQVLGESYTGLYNWAGEYMRETGIQGEDGESEVIVRLLLATSRSFKKERTRQLDPGRAEYYRLVPLPHFVWVAELYDRREFIKNGRINTDARAFGELVLDATFSKNEDVEDAVLVWNFPDRYGIRTPDDEPEMIGDNEDESRICREGFDHGADGRPGIAPLTSNLDRITIR